MKYIMLSIVMALSTASVASDLTIITAGKPGGTFDVRSSMYADALNAQGLSVDQTKNLSAQVASKTFADSEQAVLMVWIDSLAPVVELDINESFVALEYTSPMFLCQKTTDSATVVGYPKIYPLWPMRELGFKNLIPYKNSGETLNAAIAGEINTVYINQKVALKLEEIGFKCDQLENITQTAFVVAKNIDKQLVRQAVIQAQKSNDFIKWQEKYNLNTVEHNSYSDDLTQALDAQNKWLDK